MVLEDCECQVKQIFILDWLGFSSQSYLYVFVNLDWNDSTNPLDLVFNLNSWLDDSKFGDDRRLKTNRHNTLLDQICLRCLLQSTLWRFRKGWNTHTASIRRLHAKYWISPSILKYFVWSLEAVCVFKPLMFEEARCALSTLLGSREIVMVVITKLAKF